jgi:hypothetical protein
MCARAIAGAARWRWPPPRGRHANSDGRVPSGPCFLASGRVPVNARPFWGRRAAALARLGAMGTRACRMLARLTFGGRDPFGRPTDEPPATPGPLMSASAADFAVGNRVEAADRAAKRPIPLPNVNVVRSRRGLGGRQAGVEVEEHDLRHEQPEGAADLARDQFGDEGLLAVTGTAKLGDVQPIVVCLDHRRQRAAFSQWCHVSRGGDRADPSASNGREAWPRTGPIWGVAANSGSGAVAPGRSPSDSLLLPREDAPGDDPDGRNAHDRQVLEQADVLWQRLRRLADARQDVRGQRQQRRNEEPGQCPRPKHDRQ